jgi:hypothetical protein
MPRIRDLGVSFSHFMGGTCNDPSGQTNPPDCDPSGPPPPCQPSGPPPPPPCDPSRHKRCEPSGVGGGQGGMNTAGLSAAAVAQLRRQMRAQM